MKESFRIEIESNCSSVVISLETPAFCYNDNQLVGFCRITESSEV